MGGYSGGSFKVFKNDDGVINPIDIVALIATFCFFRSLAWSVYLNLALNSGFGKVRPTKAMGRKSVC